MKMRAIVIALVAAAALGADAAAQIATGNIMGAVKDEQSGALPGALVTLKGVDATQTATTDNTGEFRFLNLAPGAYSLTISLPGFKTFVRATEVLFLDARQEREDEVEAVEETADELPF